MDVQVNLKVPLLCSSWLDTQVSPMGAPLSGTTSHLDMEKVQYVLSIHCILFVQHVLCVLCVLCITYYFPAIAGEWDGAGEVVKHALRMEQMQNPDRQLQNAAQCADFLQEGFST